MNPCALKQGWFSYTYLYKPCSSYIDLALKDCLEEVYKWPGSFILIFLNISITPCFCIMACFVYNLGDGFRLGMHRCLKINEKMNFVYDCKNGVDTIHCFTTPNNIIKYWINDSCISTLHFHMGDILHSGGREIHPYDDRILVKRNGFSKMPSTWSCQFHLITLIGSIFFAMYSITPVFSPKCMHTVFCFSPDCIPNKITNIS